MSPKDKEAIKLYLREWKKNHPDKVKVWQHNAYMRHREERIVQQKKYAYNPYIHALSGWELRFLQKTRVLSAYSNPGGIPVCNNCGEQNIDTLCLDHIWGSGSKHRKQIGVQAGQHFYIWVEKNGYPKGYQVLCANCNTTKRRFDSLA